MITSSREHSIGDAIGSRAFVPIQCTHPCLGLGDLNGVHEEWVYVCRGRRISDAVFRVSTAFFCVSRFGLIVWGFFVAEEVVAKGVSESVPDQRVI